MLHGSLRAGLLRGMRSRHPLVRLLTGVLGLLAVLLFIALGMFAVVALVIGSGVFLLVNALRSARPAAQPAHAPVAPMPGVIEGEFTVVPTSPRASQPR